MDQPGIAQLVDHAHQLIGVHPEGGTVARAFLPLAADLVGELHPHTQKRLDPQFLIDGDDGVGLFRAFQHDHGVEAQLAAENGQPDELGILDPVADNQRVRGQLVRQRDHQFGFRPGLEPVTVAVAEFDDTVDNLRLLVDLDREHAAIGALVARAGDGVGKAVVDMADLVLEIGTDPQDHRGANAALFQIVQDAGQADRIGLGAERVFQPDLTLFCHHNQALAPFVHAIDGMRCVKRMFQSGRPFLRLGLRCRVAL